jgi:hypothetical protein
MFFICKYSNLKSALIYRLEGRGYAEVVRVCKESTVREKYRNTALNGIVYQMHFLLRHLKLCIFSNIFKSVVCF